jgi:hypothetical protein
MTTSFTQTYVLETSASGSSVSNKPAFEQLQALPEKLNYLNSMGTVASQNIVDPTNDNFELMASLWQEGQYRQIVKDTNVMQLCCICDVRICVYYLYSLWATSPSVKTEDIINTLTKLLDHKQQPWKATLEHKNETQLWQIFFVSTSLFFRQILKRIGNSNITQKTNDSSAENVLQSLDNFEVVINNLQPEIRENLSNSILCLRKYCSTLETEKKANKLELQTFTQNINNTDKETPEEQSGYEIGSLVRLNTQSDNTPHDPNTFAPSYPLQLLFKRIELLHKLIETQQDLKAAIVLKDIQSELDNFNPLLYLPEYFISFAALRASNVDNLEPYFSQQESYQWQALQEYYKTDMQAFLDSKDANDPLASKPSYLPNRSSMSAKTGQPNLKAQTNQPDGDHDD